jgi:ABC-type sugar transport system ATPase subunit
VIFPTQKLTRHAAGQAVLGVRPEHISISDAGEIAATVGLIEQLGAQTLLVCDTGLGSNLRVLSGREDRFTKGMTCRLDLNSQKMHLFDAEDGSSLLSQ